METSVIHFNLRGVANQKIITQKIPNSIVRRLKVVAKF